MSILENLKTAAKSLYANKLRSFLTLLGVVIGVYAVVTLLAAAQGVQQQITGSIEDLGPKTIIVIPGESVPAGTPNFAANFAPSTLFLSDIEHLKQHATLIEEDIDYAVFIGGLVSKDDKRLNGFPLGISPGAEEMFSAVIKTGRTINDQDLTQKSKVILLSVRAAEKLDVTVGDQVNIGPNGFTLIGLFEIEQDLNLTTSTGDMFLIPATVANEINQSSQINRIVAYAKDVEQVDKAKTEIETLLGEKHGSQDFTVLKPTDLLDTINQITDILAYMVVGIASVSLLVGGIGISNIMLVTVAERTREIGIRKAVGATESAILIQFLIESVVLTVIGAVIGIGLAYLTSLASAKFSPLQPIITVETVALAIVMGVVAGVIFGLFPAIRAARKNPVAALRYE